MLDTSEETLTPVAVAAPRAPATPPTPLNAEEDDELSPETRAEMFGKYEESMRSIGEGEIVRGTVLAVDEKEVLVDVGFKSEGVISLAEFPDPSSIKVGALIDVFLEKMENQDGLVVLSKQRADFVRVWDRVKEAHDSGQVVQFGIARVSFRYCSAAVRQEILAGNTPLGRILIRHNVLRRVQPTAFLRIVPGSALAL